jgi:membrane associated rhomboid family serine protease
MSVAELFDLSLRYYGPGLWLLLAVAVAELLNLVLLRKLNAFGIVPREVSGLPGIVLGPLLHMDFRHFCANLLPLGVLGLLLGRLMPEHFWRLVGAIVAGGGLLVWGLARRRNHLGASGLVYGLLGFLTLHGFLAGDWVSLGLSVLLLVLYSGLLWGVLPTAARASWESHLFGLGVGLGLAWWRVW